MVFVKIFLSPTAFGLAGAFFGADFFFDTFFFADFFLAAPLFPASLLLAFFCRGVILLPAVLLDFVRLVLVFFLAAIRAVYTCTWRHEQAPAAKRLGHKKSLRAIPGSVQD